MKRRCVCLRLWLSVLLVCCSLFTACSGMPVLPIQNARPLTTVIPVKKSAEQADTAASGSTQTESEVIAQSAAPLGLPRTTPEQETAQAAVTEAPMIDGVITIFEQDVPEDTIFIALVKRDLGIDDQTDQYEIWITHQSEELISCLVDLKKGETRTLIPYTYSVQEQRACFLGDFFSKKDTGWKGLLPDLVTNEALEQGLILLCEVPPVTENHPFYILNGSIVLLYRPYEITTFEAGSPQFILDMQKIAQYTTGAFGVGGL